jgi:putative two-component system response regulator
MNGDRQIIILVDDDTTSLSMGKSILEDKYILYLASCGEKLFDLINRVIPDLILLDVEMPEMNGYEVIRHLKANPDTQDIPVVFLTANADLGSELEGLNLGAIDYVTKPFSAPMLLKRIENHLLLSAQKKELRRFNLNLREMVAAQTYEIKNLQNGILNIVAEVVETRSEMASGHIERTKAYLKEMIDALIRQGIYKEETAGWEKDFLIPASQLHDVGKLCISEQILNKPGQLTEEEFEEIKKHPAYGIMIINKIKQTIGSHAFLDYAGIFIESHHERWDGTGYPAGLKGANIPLLGRLMAIADMYDALVSVRPYKQPLSPMEAKEEIIKGAGNAFDPELVEVFSTLAEEFARIAERQDILI